MLITRACLGLAVIVTLGTLALNAMAAPATASLNIRPLEKGVKVSPQLFGIFFEEINCAGDGGLYAELVRNRSLEDAKTPEHWNGVGRVELSIDTTNPVSEKNKHALRLRLDPEQGGFAGVANEGYWGIAVDKGAEYDLSLFARAKGFNGPLEVRIEGHDGTSVYARTEITVIEESWKSYRATLVASETDTKARLVVGARNPGEVWLDVVSLFPKKALPVLPYFN